jgi:ubiquinone/menaquinone biosynthesis C-methylase UbiE
LKTESPKENYFDKAAASWDDDPGKVHMARTIAGEIAKRVPLNSDMVAMEFGCGTGTISMVLAPRLKRVVAVDSSAKMIETLNRKIGEAQAGNISASLIDPKDLLVPSEEKFHLIFSSMVFHHIQDTDRLLRVLNGTMEQGGTLAVADLDREDGNFHGDIPDVHHLGFQREELAGKMEEAGFRSVRSATAHIIPRQGPDGKTSDYPIFLMTALKG